MDQVVATQDGIYYYLCWNGPATKGLKYFGGASAAQAALNGGTAVIQIASQSSWDFWFNNFYVAGTGAFTAAEDRDVTEIARSMVPAGFDPDAEPDEVVDHHGNVVARRLA